MPWMWNKIPIIRSQVLLWVWCEKNGLHIVQKLVCQIVYNYITKLFIYLLVYIILSIIYFFYFTKFHLFGTVKVNQLSSKSVVNNSAIREYFFRFQHIFLLAFSEMSKFLHMCNFLITRSLGLNAFKCTSETIYLLQSYKHVCSVLLTVIYIYI